MAGCSGTPLPQKLGIEPDHVVVQLGRPGLLPEVEVRHRLPASADVVLFFVTERAALASGAQGAAVTAPGSAHVPQ